MTTMNRFPWAATAAIVVFAGAALAATPAERCQSGKNREAGKYVSCLQAAEAKFALASDGAARDLAIRKCSEKYRAKWPAIEAQGAGTCPSTGDQTPVAQHLDTVSADVAAVLAGGLMADLGHRLRTGQAQCRNGQGQPIPCAGTGQDGELRKGVDRGYVDNGDGTITDTRTGLVWEKLSDDGTLHDKDWQYQWPEAFLDKVAKLNQAAFAGYTDWRVPSVNELLTLVNYGVGVPAISPAFNTGCSLGCNVLTCSCTRTFYWSSTAVAPDPRRAWTVTFFGSTLPVTKGGEYHSVRAVRGGS
jgi:hypothetical protein